MRIFPKLYTQDYVNLLREQCDLRVNGLSQQYDLRVKQLESVVEFLRMQVKERNLPVGQGLMFDPANKDGAFGFSPLFEEKDDIDKFVNGRSEERDKRPVQA